MRVAIVFSILVLATVVARPVSGQLDFVALYGDSLQTGTCDGSVYNPNALAYFFIFHYSSSGTMGSRFRISRPHCIDFGGVSGPYLSAPAFPSTGSLETGIEFQYGDCRSGWIYIGRVSYWDVLGLTDGDCCEQTILPHPGAASGQVETMDCTSGFAPSAARSGIMGVRDSCPCLVVTGIRDVPATTWGRVKALYQ